MLNRLKPPAGAKRSRKRLGRGPGSGLGKTSGRGHKGYLARSGSGRKPGFEGGQMPLYRRLPKRGFTSMEHAEYLLVNLGDLARLPAGTEATLEKLLELKARKKAGPSGIKVLAKGTLSNKLTVHAHAFSAKAREAIEKAGGKAVAIETRVPAPVKRPEGRARKRAAGPSKAAKG